MKRFFFFLVFSGWMLQVMSQVSVNNNGDSPDASAMFDVQSTNKGFLPPRMTTAQRTAIQNPATGLTIFNTDLNCLEFYQAGGSGWFCPCQSNFKLGCFSEMISGTYMAGSTLNSTNTVAMSVMVYSPGGYHIRSTMVNGCSFSASGVFTTTGYQTVILQGIGTPVAGGTYSYLLLLSNTETSCSFTITFQFQLGNGTTLADFPFTTYWMDGKTQLLYKSDELQVLGGNTATITQIGFDVVGPISSQVMNGFQISMKNTTSQTVTGTWETGLTTVYSGTYTVSGTGWQMITLQTPFSWNGSNLLIQLCFDNNFYSSNTFVNATEIDNLAQSAQEDLSTASGCDLPWAIIYSFRPNLKMTLISPPSSNTCGQLVIDHIAGSVAPVNKTVTYSTITSIPGEPSKCWITKNLGATQQATAVNDATEASAGWYWQFNRKQGFKHDGSTRTPNSVWIIQSIQNMNWLAFNDPCVIELGTPWRLPTSTEWENVDNTGGWNDWNGPWNSDLKLHTAGRLFQVDGSLDWRGMYGAFWSSTQANVNASYGLTFGISHSGQTSYFKADAFSVRCLRN
jgi:hypothetical protein